MLDSCFTFIYTFSSFIDIKTSSKFLEVVKESLNEFLSGILLKSSSIIVSRFSLILTFNASIFSINSIFTSTEVSKFSLIFALFSSKALEVSWLK